ncbi:RmlC-like cupin [Glarea lozoyensis ATCC 20868]|uniref:RmlC-like cupin n=1 Tax=Glarea lozoyensis (strain ATCC 20868 / MF5171) TaxID=1116229 RepID=S3CVW6_GLAL2|nr:RmlC-like cupin [Glarea lozoyensis ATCC 20868]EPE30557.1 RmlC-like cupin [Glarea lozoyensis ATCC 20868]
MASPRSQPEQYFIKNSTPHVPNSPLPVLIYRSALPPDPDPNSVCATIEPNNWLKGGVFKHYPAHHFHSVTHECYAVFKGRSRLLLGRGPLDEESENDLLVDLNVGDAIVLPAGVAHCSLESSDDYEYVGLYPKGSPHWDNNFCKAGLEETIEKEINARAVPIPPSDPVFGAGGPLVEIWKQAAACNS